MNTYELTYILPSEAGSEQAQAKAGEIESLIQQKQGVILQRTNPTAKPLSYPIKRTASGFVGTLEFQLDPSAVQEFNSGMKQDASILRSLLVVKTPGKVKKEKRSKLKSLFSLGTAKQPVPAEPKAEMPATPVKEELPAQAGKPKVELKDIEQELDKILGE